VTFLYVLMVGIGGFFGAIGRYSISKYLNNNSKSLLPLGTLIVNLAGAFLLGILIGAKVDIIVTLLFGTGFLGAFTTFSTLKLEMIRMYLNKYTKKFFVYAILTYGIGLILAYLGYLIGTAFI
jgi:fluoride exporter